MNELAAVVGRLMLLEDERAIVARLYQYCHSLDAGQVDDLVACFTDDVEYEVRRESPAEAVQVAAPALGGSTVRCHGKDEVRAFVSGAIARGSGTRKHMLCEPRITLDGEAATGVSYYFTIDTTGGQPEVLTFGRYLDRYRRAGPDDWRIAARTVVTEARRRAA